MTILSKLQLESEACKYHKRSILETIKCQVNKKVIIKKKMHTENEAEEKEAT